MISTASNYLCQVCAKPKGWGSHVCSTPDKPATMIDRIADLEARLAKVEEWAQKGILVTYKEASIPIPSE